jgi:hypothetical protein
MLATGHIVPAVTIAAQRDDPERITLTGVMSLVTLAVINFMIHLVPLDLLPHTEPFVVGVKYLDLLSWTRWVLLADLIVAIAYAGLRFITIPKIRWRIIAACTGAALPDIFQLCFVKESRYFWWLSPIDYLHDKMHWWHTLSPDLYIILGAICSFSVCVASLMLMPKQNAETEVAQEEPIPAVA